ncbi:MAG: hypothetical protein NTV43_13510 [Methylococcales bacterium]|nr:hypothetical protein [Methylococcales bacterium]
MQVTLDIPDVIPQEIINKLITQWQYQLQTEEKLAIESNTAITTSEQLKIGREFMQEYHETFSALAK